MIFINILICVLLAYLCLYALIARICKCIEYCAITRAFSKLGESDVDVSLAKFQKIIDKFEEDNYVESKTDKK